MNIHSIESNVKFPDMEHCDMGKASDIALYLAHCDFYPFRSVIENNKIALDIIDESYRNLAEEARLKNDFVTEQWAMTSGTLHSCRVDLLTQYSLLLTMVSLLEEAVNTLCRLYYNINHLDKEVKDIKGRGLERAAKYLKDVVGIDGFTADKQWEYITVQSNEVKEMSVDWIRCPVCGSKTRNKVRDDTILKNYPLYCPKCKQETLINLSELCMKVIKEPDAKMQSR